MQYSFDKIQGPRQSRRENFEELISQLLVAELNAKPVDGSGGDGGIDCFVTNDDQSLTVYQAKYFLGRLTRSQRRQISQSLRTALQNHPVSRWILCLPINLSPDEIKWFKSLVHEGSVLDWWGETKIRQLLARHPEIAKSFFLDESLAAEFKEFRQKIEGTITALTASRWSYGHRHPESMVREYLERAARIGGLLIQDASLTERAELVYVGLDFTELFTYMSSDNRFVLSVPVVDFYIQQSPYALYLLPGAAFELLHFMQTAIPRNIDRYIDDLKADVNPLHIFLNSFEENPDGEHTRSAYNRAVDYIRSLDGPPSFNIKKLRSVLDSGKVKASTSKIPITADNDDFQNLFRSLEPRLRPQSKFVDVGNVMFLKSYAAETGHPVRMISSDRLLARVSREYFGNDSFIRNSAEYAYLIHSTGCCQTENAPSLESAASSLVGASKKLNARLKTVNITEELLSAQDSELRLIIDSFHEFAPFYRKLLRPVDEMIESGFLALPAIHAKNMFELYMILKRESDLVAGFKSWWDETSKELSTIGAILKERYLTEETISSIKEVNL